MNLENKDIASTSFQKFGVKVADLKIHEID